jgi:hypothetical protein
MFYIQGKKGRGKGVLFYVIVELIGRHNYSLVTPHILASANGLLPAEGRMLGGCADVHWPDKIISSPFLSTQLLGVINREPIEMKKLYKDLYHTIMDLRLLFGGEILPAVLAAAGIHLTDKIIVMPAKEHVPNWREVNDGKLEKKGLRELLTTPEELAGWCKWALGGDLNDIKNREEGKQQIKIMSSASSPVYQWIELLEFDVEYKVGSRLTDAKFYKYITSLKDAFNSMIYFCQTKRIDYKVGEPAFKVALESLLNNRAEYRRVNYSENERRMNYVGFRIPDEWKQKPWTYGGF